MNITAVQTFLAVVESGNLNKAAERLNVTQSTVTARLDALDAAFGQPLLVRSRRGAQLTRAGFAFRPHAETLLRSWDQAHNAVGLPSGFSALFSFACEVDLWASAGKAWFNEARQAHPDLAFEAWPASLDELKSWLASGLTDAALSTEPLAGYGITSREYACERLVQVSTTPRDAQPWHPDYVYVDHGAEFRRQHSQTWSTDQTASVTYASGAWALEHLLVEGGSAYLPWKTCKAYLETGLLHLVVGSPELSRMIYIVVRNASQTTFPWVLEP
ncbi:MAG: LysR family transcriptional regulator [Pseudomonadota bacterium]